jgi:hypothetical protein
MSSARKTFQAGKPLNQNLPLFLITPGVDPRPDFKLSALLKSCLTGLQVFC